MDCAAPPRAARFGDRHRSHQPLEHQNDELDLRKPRHPHSRLSCSVRHFADARRGSFASRRAARAGAGGGASWIATLRSIVAPLASRGLLAAWLISFVFALRDVAISIVVYPPGADTLPVRILTLMANGAPSLIAALCIILIAVTLLPLAAAGLWLKVGATRP